MPALSAARYDAILERQDLLVQTPHNGETHWVTQPLALPVAHTLSALFFGGVGVQGGSSVITPRTNYTGPLGAQ
jgi:hypothetical protein